MEPFLYSSASPSPFLLPGNEIILVSHSSFPSLPSLRMPLAHSIRYSLLNSCCYLLPCPHFCFLEAKLPRKSFLLFMSLLHTQASIAHFIRYSLLNTFSDLPLHPDSYFLETKLPCQSFLRRVHTGCDATWPTRNNGFKFTMQACKSE